MAALAATRVQRVNYTNDLTESTSSLYSFTIYFIFSLQLLLYFIVSIGMQEENCNTLAVYFEKYQGISK